MGALRRIGLNLIVLFVESSLCWNQPFVLSRDTRMALIEEEKA